MLHQAVIIMYVYNIAVTSGSDSSSSEHLLQAANIPTPNWFGSPQLCQIGRSGSWNNLDQWYSFDCSCYDVMTLYKLNQLIASMFVEFQSNFKDEQPSGSGRFESYFNNYMTHDISFKTSVTTESGVSNGPSWDNLKDLTSRDPDSPGHGLLTRSLPYDFEISPGGIYMTDCSDHGNIARARVNIVNYRIRDNGFTETQVSFGSVTLERQFGTSTWLFKDFEFGGATTGYLSVDEPPISSGADRTDEIMDESLVSILNDDSHKSMHDTDGMNVNMELSTSSLINIWGIMSLIVLVIACVFLYNYKKN